MLTISGERKTEHEQQQEGYYRLERAFGGFSRSLTLPDGVDPDSVQAHFDRGVLEIRIPKPEQKKPRTVQITLGTNRRHQDDREHRHQRPESQQPRPGPSARLIPNSHPCPQPPITLVHGHRIL